MKKLSWLSWSFPFFMLTFVCEFLFFTNNLRLSCVGLLTVCSPHDPFGHEYHSFSLQRRVLGTPWKSFSQNKNNLFFMWISFIHLRLRLYSSLMLCTTGWNTFSSFELLVKTIVLCQVLIHICDSFSVEIAGVNWMIHFRTACPCFWIIIFFMGISSSALTAVLLKPLVSHPGAATLL